MADRIIEFRDGKFISLDNLPMPRKGDRLLVKAGTEPYGHVEDVIPWPACVVVASPLVAVLPLGMLPESVQLMRGEFVMSTSARRWSDETTATSIANLRPMRQRRS